MESRFNVKFNGDRLNSLEIICNKLEKFGVDEISDIKRYTFHVRMFVFSIDGTNDRREDSLSAII
jgi:hypothetical protein